VVKPPAPTTARETSSTSCGGSVCEPAFDDPELVIYARGFAALSDPTRLRLVALLAANPTTGVCVCDLVDHVDRSQPTVSHHLRVLREAGLVSSDKRGVWTWYRLDGTRLGRLAAVLG